MKYSVRLAENLSEVLDSMNLSHSSAILKGSIQGVGKSALVQESKFKATDLNLIISMDDRKTLSNISPLLIVAQVQVSRQMIAAESCTFHPLQGVEAGSATFNKVFGDSYISGLTFCKQIFATC